MSELLQALPWLTTGVACVVLAVTLAYIADESAAEERFRLWRERVAHARKLDRIVRGFIRSRGRGR